MQHLVAIRWLPCTGSECERKDKPLNITLEEDAEVLNDVVVIGYGMVKKADLAGSVSVMDNKQFKDQPITQSC